LFLSSQTFATKSALFAHSIVQRDVRSWGELT
jgi:hypothetical protein